MLPPRAVKGSRGVLGGCTSCHHQHGKIATAAASEHNTLNGFSNTFFMAIDVPKGPKDRLRHPTEQIERVCGSIASEELTS